MACNDHAEGITHQQDIYSCFAEGFGKCRVVAGQHGNFFALLFHFLQLAKGDVFCHSGASLYELLGGFYEIPAITIAEEISMLENKYILLGVTGGVAAYKSAELVRRLRDAGAEVRVVMTAAAKALVAPLTFQALSGHAVLSDWQEQGSNFAMDHIALTRWADLILIAPATADFMAKLAHGFADDVLSTLCLAATVPIVLAPAMNKYMWENPVTRLIKNSYLNLVFALLDPTVARKLAAILV